MIVANRYVLANMLDELRATGATLNLCSIKLFVNDITPTPDSDTPDFTECTMTGYASVPLVWTPATIQPDGFAALVANLAAFSFTVVPPEVVQTVYGYYVVKTTGGAFNYAERFDTPFTPTYVGQQLFVLPRFTMAQ